MAKAGVDTSTFKAHSICSASVSNIVLKPGKPGKAGMGMSVRDILAGGRWTQESTLKKFYLRDIV